MIFLVLNVGLALVWLLLTGGGLLSLATGFLVGFGAIALSRWFLGSQAYVRGVLGTVRLAAYFMADLVVANLRLARDVLFRPGSGFTPAIVRIGTGDLGAGQTALLACLTSLTPGTLTLDMEDDGHALYVHTMYGSDEQEARDDVRRVADLIHAASGRLEARS